MDLGMRAGAHSIEADPIATGAVVAAVVALALYFTFSRGGRR
jgi:hypothetical protein